MYVGKPIGVRRLTAFLLDENTDTVDVPATYGEPIKLSRAIQIVTTPVLAEALLESDDGVEDELAHLNAIDVTINASQLTDTIRAQLLGHRLDENGGVVFKNTDMGPLVALAWEELLSKADGTGADQYKRVVLYKGRFKEFVETAETAKREGITFQTHNLVAKFYKRDYDGYIKYSMREDTPNVDAAAFADWFTAVQEPAPLVPVPPVQ